MDTGPEELLQAFFLLSALLVLVVNAVPAVRDRFLAYGSRASTVPPTTSASSSLAGRIGAILDYLATFQVPHAWFAHFYVVSVFASVFWASQWLGNGRALRSISSAAANVRALGSPRMSVEQAALAWSLMTIQGSRRLYESIALAKPSAARMWFVHWLLGIGFYAAMSLAVWIESAPLGRTAVGTSYNALSPIRSVLSLMLFAAASTVQHTCHTYVASLKKYTLPTHPYFRSIIYPHYTAECVIYLSLSIVAAPPHRLFNRTIFAAFVFVVVNLGATAETGRIWYARKFGADKISGRWRMAPPFF